MTDKPAYDVTIGWRGDEAVYPTATVTADSAPDAAAKVLQSYRASVIVTCPDGTRYRAPIHPVTLQADPRTEDVG